MLGKRLTYLRGKLTQDEVANALGISRSRYSHYETGRSEPDIEILQKLAYFFKTSTDYLLGISDSQGNTFLKIPILGTIRTALPLLVQESYDGYLDVPDYMQADFALKVTGDSMIGACILDGDYVVCKEANTAQNGQIVVAVKDLGTGFAAPTLKYYFDNGRDRYLRAANPHISDIPMEEDHRIAGVMEGLIRKEAPGYHIYRDYLTSGGNNDWAEVIELANSAGMKTNQVKEILAAQIEIAKRIKRRKIVKVYRR